MYRFGPFQVDPRAHELRRSGIRIKVQEQPFVVLLKLLERPGELVTREELRSTIWPADTFVDFETGLNTVIKRLREVLRDSAEVPLFIETVPKLGYRFIGPVDASTESGWAPQRQRRKGASRQQQNGLSPRQFCSPWHGNLLAKCQILEEETLTRAKQANESSETDPKESKHGEDLYQNAGGGDRSYAIDFKGGRNFGERQGDRTNQPDSSRLGELFCRWRFE